MKRKYNTLEYINDPKVDIQELLQRIRSESSRKRPEENQKFVFKFALKNMKKLLKKQSNRKFKKKDLEEYFLLYYFKETSERMNVPLNLFVKPSDSNKSLS